jgi:hypothetical protein
VTLPEDDQEISPVYERRTFLHKNKTTRECLSEYSEAGGQSYVHRSLQNSLSYILEGLTVQELISVVKCIVYLLNERRNLNKNAMHKERQILLAVNLRITEAHFHSLLFAQRCFRTSLNYANNSL